MATIEVRNLYKIFGRNPERAFPLIEKGLSKDEVLEQTGCTIGINDASFTVENRETFVIMGLSGSGKSTVIRCLNRLIEPTRGRVLLDGQDVMELDKKAIIEARRFKMSMVFQNFGLLPQRTVMANVEYGLEVAGVEREERRRKAAESLELVGLKGYEDSRPRELSGGMQQRVGLARALASSPEILLMDEAFSALDPLIRTQMQDELIDLQDRLHKTIVFITHDLDEALKLGDRVAIMKDGMIVQIGTPEDILTRPADDYVRAFVQNVDRAKFITAGTVMRKAPTISVPKDGPRMAMRVMEKLGSSTVFCVDRERRLKGLLSVDDAIALEKEGQRNVEQRLLTDLYVTHPESPISDLLATAMTSKYPLAVVSDEQKLLGIVDRATIMAEVIEQPDEEDAPTPFEADGRKASPGPAGKEKQHDEP